MDPYQHNNHYGHTLAYTESITSLGCTHLVIDPIHIKVCKKTYLQCKHNNNMDDHNTKSIASTQQVKHKIHIGHHSNKTHQLNHQFSIPQTHLQYFELNSLYIKNIDLSIFNKQPSLYGPNNLLLKIIIYPIDNIIHKIKNPQIDIFQEPQNP